MTGAEVGPAVTATHRVVLVTSTRTRRVTRRRQVRAGKANLSYVGIKFAGKQRNTILKIIILYGAMGRFPPLKFD